MNLFLEFEAKHIADDKNVLCQGKYITDLLHKACMHSAKPMPTLMVSNLKLSTYDSSLFLDTSLYITIVHGLQYMTITWRNVAFAVNKCNQFMYNPLNSHQKAVKWILRYLQGTLNHGLTFRKSIDFRLLGFCDVD